MCIFISFVQGCFLVFLFSSSHLTRHLKVRPKPRAGNGRQNRVVHVPDEEARVVNAELLLGVPDSAVVAGGAEVVAGTFVGCFLCCVVCVLEEITLISFQCSYFSDSVFQ